MGAELPRRTGPQEELSRIHGLVKDDIGRQEQGRDTSWWHEGTAFLQGPQSPVLHFFLFWMTFSFQLPQTHLHPETAKLLVPKVYSPLPCSKIALWKASTTSNSNFGRILIYVLSSISLHMNAEFPQHSH